MGATDTSARICEMCEDIKEMACDNGTDLQIVDKAQSIIQEIRFKKCGLVHKVKAEFDMDIPRECYECRFQLKFKDDEVDDWYSRRCVLMQRIIEYPRPDWCPLVPVKQDDAT